jgi:GNAT superfamily N-acetyltransferase
LNIEARSISCFCLHSPTKSSTASVDLFQENIWWVSRVFVHKDYRRQGVGTELVNKIKKAIPKNCRLMVCPGGYDMTLKDQKAFYSSLGFVDSIHNGEPCMIQENLI